MLFPDRIIIYGLYVSVEDHGYNVDKYEFVTWFTSVELAKKSFDKLEGVTVLPTWKKEAVATFDGNFIVASGQAQVTVNAQVKRLYIIIAEGYVYNETLQLNLNSAR